MYLGKIWEDFLWRLHNLYQRLYKKEELFLFIGKYNTNFILIIYILFIVGQEYQEVHHV